jgi:hypothetical protein
MQQKGIEKSYSGADKNVSLFNSRVIEKNRYCLLS